MPMIEQNTTPSALRDIMQYESKIWEIADLLIAASIKQSDFPTYMMPFFALVMLEGRMRNAIRQVEEEEHVTAKDDPKEFEEIFLERDCGFNKYIVLEGVTLSSICANDSTFAQDFKDYLEAFDAELRKLLGIKRGKDEDKFLDIDGIVAKLKSKGILLQVVTSWSKIDLSPYSNSDITTLEEHIKRKWADISASTAGEQYTPDDIISLIAEIVAEKVQKPKNEYVHVYDPTCGGANLLFGVADRLRDKAGYKNIATYGSEYNDALYALAAIESRFRNDSKISYGNTLTTVPFHGTEFDVVVANPPYGTKWSGYESEVKKDQLGQFPGGLPGIGDGQMLFMQHILWQLSKTGIAVEVHNGSTLFSGDAGSGESNIRKYIFDHDWVEAIIQMPQQEFFNTGIYTYLWIMNKNKVETHRNKVMLIDCSKLWKQLKKSKGDKRREMTPEHRRQIVDALVNFEDCAIGKVYDKWHFYYNKQSLTLLDESEDGKSVLHTCCAKTNPLQIQYVEKVVLDGEEIVTFKATDKKALAPIEAKIKACDFHNEKMEIVCKHGIRFMFDSDNNTILEIAADGKVTDLGCGKFTTKIATSKKEGAVLKLQIEPHYYTDYEIIAYNPQKEENQALIKSFLDKYVFKQYYFTQAQIEPVVGVEINFNKEFYQPEEIGSVDKLLSDIAKLDEELKEISL